MRQRLNPMNWRVPDPIVGEVSQLKPERFPGASATR